MELFFSIKKSPDFIFDYLTDMQKFAFVHPVISKIEKTSDGMYLVHETLKMGFIPVSFTYPATVEYRPNESIVIIRATVMKLTTIEMAFLIKPESETTVVEEHIKIKSLLPVRKLMESIFRTQHSKMFKNIENV
jgi:carbon monoxide dehydrogenase subunit G